jgi:hypothetical protein
MQTAVNVVARRGTISVRERKKLDCQSNDVEMASPGLDRTTAGMKPASLDEVESFYQFFYDLRELKEIIAVVRVPDNDESAARCGNSSHQRAAIAGFVDRYDARSLTLGDSSRQIGAAIIRHQNFARDVMLAESFPHFLDATCQSILLVKAGNNN